MTAKHQINTYTYLYATAKWIKEQQIPDEFPGYATYRRISYYTFLALTLEAFINHCSYELLPWWDDSSEKDINIRSKINIILHHCKIDFSLGERPRQTINNLIKLRNEFAHGKTEVVSQADGFLQVGDFKIGIWEDASWMRKMKQLNEQQVSDDFAVFCQRIWDTSGLSSTHPNPFGVMGAPPRKN